MAAYYNEHEPYAAQWLRNLIKAGQIAPGDVDERSISDVQPDDLRGYDQCHFFAGIGVWSYALRRAGWPDDRPVWSGSAPCQPYSSAGQGKGNDDERHLWPQMFRLIRECRPVLIVGEQVEAAIRHGWLDLVSTDLEAQDYAVGSVVLGAHSVGAPHIRQRLYWCAAHLDRRSLDAAPILVDAAGLRCDHQWGTETASLQGQCAERSRQPAQPGCAGELPGRSEGLGGAGGVADLHGNGRDQAGECVAQARGDGPVGDGAAGELGLTNGERARRNGRAVRGALDPAGRQHGADDVGAPSGAGGLEHPGSQRRHGRQAPASGHDHERPEPVRAQGQHGSGVAGAHRLHQPAAGPTNGFWRAADWLLCRDGRWRPAEPGTSPLVAKPASIVGRGGPDWHTPAGSQGSGHRAGRLKGYGNALCAESAVAFIESVIDITGAN